MKWYRFVSVVAMVLAVKASVARADIYRVDNGQVIPGTEGIEPGPGVQLDHMQLNYAKLGAIPPDEGMDLTGASFEESNLTNANFWESTLTNANLTGANLTGASLSYSTLTNADLTGANLTGANFNFSTLTNADLTGAVVTGTGFQYTTSLGFTAAQLYSTQSYQEKNLSGIILWGNDFTGWDFSGQNLSNAYMGTSTLTNANLTGANLTHATFPNSSLTNANLTGAVVTQASFSGTTSRGFTASQLYSTPSYQAKDLSGIRLADNDLTGWDFRGQNLTYADMGSSTLTNADLTGAVVTGADFSYFTTSRGFMAAQLYSTQSYHAKDLSGIRLRRNDFTGWDFSGQNLSNAYMDDSTLTNANLSGANLTHATFENSSLTNANLTGAVVTGASFGGTTSRGFTASQLYSTQSYQEKNLSGIRLRKSDLTGWDFHEQNLTNAWLGDSTLTNANLTGANLKNTNLVDATGLTSAKFSPGSVYSQWTQFPIDFSPVASGLTNSPSSPGDLDANDTLDVADIEMLQQRARGAVSTKYLLYGWLPKAMFDLNNDSSVTQDDVAVWVKDLKHTWYGDADLNGEFSSADFVQVFQAGKYEQGWVDAWGGIYDCHGTHCRVAAGWSEGDWNGDGLFDSNDFVTAFQDGGYEQGPRTDAAAVPEPGAWTLLVIGFVLWLFGFRFHRAVS